jgi:nitronate monooxygenase
MWPNKRLIDLLGIEHPIVLSPMAGIGTPALAAAVCEEGGLGSIGCGPLPPAVAAETIQALRRLTKRPINVNFFCHVRATIDANRDLAWRERLAPYYRELGLDPDAPPPVTDIPPFGNELCAIVENARPEVVSFHFGLPERALLRRVKAAGCRVLSSATTVEEALWLEAHGADAIIAQGFEAGGHRGTFLATDVNRAMATQTGTLALVPQIVDAVDVPVIAAGGIADGRGIAAALALGAAAVQIGTAFLLCPEAAAPAVHRDALRRTRGCATVVSNLLTGRPARLLPNRLTLEMGPILSGLPDFPLPMGALQPLRAKAEQRASSDFTPLWAGQAAALAQEVPAGALTRRLAAQAIECAHDAKANPCMGMSPTTAS